MVPWTLAAPPRGQVGDRVGNVGARNVLAVRDLASVRAFALRWSGRLHVLINNAGVMDLPLQRNADGLDL